MPAAFVTLKAGTVASSELEDAIRRQVADVISKIAIPERVFFTDALPKTPSGKIMRRLLKEILETGDILVSTPRVSKIAHRSSSSRPW